MQRTLLLFLAALLVVPMIGGCARTTLSGSWRNPDFRQPVNKLYLVGVSRHETSRRIFEDAFARELATYGVGSVASYRDLGDVQNASQETIMTQARASGADALLITRILGKRTEEVVRPGRVTGYGPGWYYPYPYYRYYRDYYERRYEMIYEPASVTRYTVVTLESNLYAVATGELIWSAQFETLAEGPLEALIRDFIAAVTKDLLDKGVI